MHAPLINRLSNKDEFVDYVSDIVVEQETNTKESIEAVEDILERLFLDNPEICMEVLRKQTVIWKNFDDCCCCNDNGIEIQAKKVIWDFVLENQMIEVSWHNFNCYYCCYGLTGELSSWLDKNMNKLTNDEEAEDISDSVISDIIVEDISLESFKKFIDRFRVDEFTNNLEEFSMDKIQILVREQYIPFSITTLDEMKAEAPELVIEYIMNNIDAFYIELDNVSLELNYITKLLDKKELDSSKKMKLFDLFAATEIDIEMASIIRTLDFSLPKAYVESAWDQLVEKDRYQLLLYQLEVYSLDEISEKLSLLEPVYQALSGREKRHKACLPVDDIGYNGMLLEKLKKMNYLTSIEIEETEKDNFITHEKEVERKYVVWVKQK